MAVLAGLSRAAARRLVDEGGVAAGGDRVGPRDRLAEGLVLTIRIPEEPGLTAEPVPFTVRYEDRHVAVVDKPPGVVAHPGAGHQRGTLAAGLLARWPDLAGVGEQQRWGIVHRLDRDTSGIMIVALTEPAYRALRRSVGERAVVRRYRALVRGRFEVPTGTIDAPIGRDPRHPTRMAVRGGGRPARTHYRWLASWEQPVVSLLEVRLETGRTHQIRVHLASIGHDLVGDTVYGRRGPEGVDPGRVWLHAHALEFIHPVTGAPMAVESPLPPDLRDSLDVLGTPGTQDAGPPDRRPR